MIYDEFEKNLDKYNVMKKTDVKSSRIYYDKIDSDITIDLEYQNEVSFGSIQVSVKNPNNTTIYYNDLKIAELSVACEKSIPCAFFESGKITVKGTCDNLSIIVTGAKIIIKDKIGQLPNNQYIYKNRGSSDLLSYSTIDDIKNDNLTVVRNMINLDDLQTIYYNSTKYIGRLNIINGVLYLCTSRDDYAVSLVIASGVTQARILVADSSSDIYIVYIKSNRLYYVTVQDLQTVSSENKIDISDNLQPKSLSQIIAGQNNGYVYFGVNYIDGTMQLFVLNTKFVSVLTRNADFSKIFIGNGFVEIYSITDYSVAISKYTYSNGVVTQSATTQEYLNVNDVLKIGDKYLLFMEDICIEKE